MLRLSNRFIEDYGDWDLQMTVMGIGDLTNEGKVCKTGLGIKDRYAYGELGKL